MLGTTITSDLSWKKNTSKIVSESNKRIQFLHRAKKFTSNVTDLKKIYMLQVRSKLEQSAPVWHSSLTKKSTSDLERVQKCALRVILGDKYTNYKDALGVIKLDSLEDRREKLCLKFAKQCLRHEKLNGMFPRRMDKHPMEKRGFEKFVLHPKHAKASQPTNQRKRGMIK